MSKCYDGMCHFIGVIPKQTAKIRLLYDQLQRHTLVNERQTRGTVVKTKIQIIVKKLIVNV